MSCPAGVSTIDQRHVAEMLDDADRSRKRRARIAARRRSPDARAARRDRPARRSRRGFTLTPTRAVRPPGSATVAAPPSTDVDADGEEIHARRADEGGDELVGRVVVELERRADLGHPPPVEHDDLVGERHRLGLVVGDVDHRRAESRRAAWRARAASARAAWRRGWKAARRTGRPRACAPARGRSRRADAGRPTARPGGGRDRPRAGGCARPRARARPAPCATRRRARARRRCSACTVMCG